MITLESFTDDVDQVEHLIRWWISQNLRRYHHVRVRGTVRDFINDVWTRLLTDFPPGKSVDCALTTAVSNSCQWELFKYVPVGTIHPQRLYWVRRIKPDDLIEDGSHAESVAIHNERDRCFAKLMRTLTYREAVVIRARFGLFGDPELTLSQVGCALKINRERVRQIEGKAIKKIQHHNRAKHLLPFVYDPKRDD